MKRIFPLLMAGLMTVPALVSCGGGGNTETQTTAAVDTAVTTVGSTETSRENIPDNLPEVDTAVTTVGSTETSRENIPDNLPEKDYKGYSFRILAGTEDDYYQYMLAEEQTGSSMNDAIYSANIAVEERFNIKFGRTPIPQWTDRTVVEQMISAGDDSFDLAYTQDITAATLSMEGMLYNLYDVPYVDVSQPWWPAFTTESMTLNGKMYLISNSSTWFGFYGTRTIFFNKEMIEDNNLENPYDLVRENKWTLDKLISITKDFFKDVNGDGVRDYTDIYGFAMTVPYALYENFGFEAYKKVDNNTRVELDVYNEKTVVLMEKLCSWLLDGKNGARYAGSHSGRYNEDSSNTWFANGTVLYTYGAIGHLLKGLADTDTVYGLLPMCKTDENQENYVCATDDLPGFIPVTVADKERCGIILEAMSAEGYKKVFPSYYEYALKGRYAQDSDSCEMIDLMFANRILSFSYMYGGSGNGFQHVCNLVLNNGGNFASLYESKRSFNEERITLINEWFSKKD